MRSKLIICLFAVFVAVTSVKAEFYDSIYDAQREALRDAKLMLFFVVTDTCPYCHRLMNDVLSNRAFLQYLDENLVVAVANLNTNGIIPKDLVFRGVTPTIYLLTPTGNVIGQPIEGAIDSNSLFGIVKGLREYQRGRLGF